MLPGEADTAVQLHAFLRGVHRAGPGDRFAASELAGLWPGTGIWTRPCRSNAHWPTPDKGTPSG